MCIRVSFLPNTFNYFFLLLGVKILLFLIPRDEQNILEAASSGASASIGLVANIAANLIAFLAILAFINEALGWLGGMVGYPSITFQVCLSTRMVTALEPLNLNHYSDIYLY